MPLSLVVLLVAAVASLSALEAHGRALQQAATPSPAQAATTRTLYQYGYLVSFGQQALSADPSEFVYWSLQVGESTRPNSASNPVNFKANIQLFMMRNTVSGGFQLGLYGASGVSMGTLGVAPFRVDRTARNVSVRGTVRLALQPGYGGVPSFINVTFALNRVPCPRPVVVDGSSTMSYDKPYASMHGSGVASTCDTQSFAPGLVTVRWDADFIVPVPGQPTDGVVTTYGYSKSLIIDASARKP